MKIYEPRVLLTGSEGFLGRFIQKELSKNLIEYSGVSSKQYDLRSQEDCRDLFRSRKFNTIIHAAGACGGIGANAKHPGKFLYDNTIMGLNLIELSREFCIDKFVLIGTICSYPRNTPVPFHEYELENGEPDRSNFSYGISKRTLGNCLQGYYREYGLKGAYCLPVNLFGPGDSTDIDNAHIIPAIIMKCLDAKRNNKKHIECYGTGNCTREFLYAADCAEGIIKAMLKINNPEPINLGVSKEQTIRDIVKLIVKCTGFEGDILWKTEFGDGQPRRSLSIDRAKELLDWEPTTNFESGLKATIEWYKKELNYES